MKEIFSIHVILTQTHTLHCDAGQVNLVLFTGRCDCSFFHGEILPGGVDTQRFPAGGQGSLSARYMLAGVDDQGAPTRIFIENNGVFDDNGVCVTRPVILTDNPRLRWLEQTAFTGSITGHDRGVDIHFSV